MKISLNKDTILPDPNKDYGAEEARQLITGLERLRYDVEVSHDIVFNNIGRYDVKYLGDFLDNISPDGDGWKKPPSTHNILGAVNNLNLGDGSYSGLFVRDLVSWPMSIPYSYHYGSDNSTIIPRSDKLYYLVYHIAKCYVGDRDIMDILDDIINLNSVYHRCRERSKLCIDGVYTGNLLNSSELALILLIGKNMSINTSSRKGKEIYLPPDSISFTKEDKEKLTNANRKLLHSVIRCALLCGCDDISIRMWAENMKPKENRKAWHIGTKKEVINVLLNGYEPNRNGKVNFEGYTRPLQKDKYVIFTLLQKYNNDEIDASTASKIALEIMKDGYDLEEARKEFPNLPLK